MQIDWVTVAAQALNFLVLVWLLKHFLYGPITRAMQRREQRIQKRFDDAEAKREEAQREADSYREQQRKLQDEREALLKEARQQARETAQELEQQARDEVAQKRKAWQQQLEAEQTEFLEGLKQRAAKHFYDLAQRALNDLAGRRLQDALAARFIVQLDDLESSQRKKARKAIGRSDRDITIQTGFALEPAEKSQLTKAVHDAFDTDRGVRYVNGDDIGLGLRLEANGYSLEWSLQSYIDALRENLEQALSQNAGGNSSKAQKSNAG
ncbi:MAG: ATP synthase subunit B [Sphingomonadales bacterium]